MSDLSDLMDKLDDAGVLRSADSTAFFSSGAGDASYPIVSSSLIPFTGLFFSFFLVIFLFIVIFANTFASFFGRVFFWDS